MPNRRKSWARALGAVACVIFATSALGAGISPGAASASTDDRLQHLLEHNPGSVRIAPDTVRTPDGVEISLPTAAAGAKAMRAGATAAAAERCSSEDLCLFQNQLWEGEKLTLPADCTFRALWTYKLSNGQTWDKHVDSYINNNPKAGTWATLWNVWGGAGDIAEMNYWDIVESHRSAGPSAPSNAISGLPWADRVAAVRVCQP
jgi:hypothetical protein